MKINFVVPSTVLGGGLRVILIYANYLTDKGHDVCIYLPGVYYWKDAGKVSIKTSIANSILRRNKLPWFNNKCTIKVVPLIRNAFVRNADVTIATAWFTARDVYELSVDKGKKAYFIQDYEIWHQNKEVVDATYKLDMKRVTITNTLREVIKKECGVESEVIYNGHNSSEYITSEKKRNNPKTVIMLGNFADYKGGKVGLEILKRMHEKYNIRIIIFSAQRYETLPNYVEFYYRPERRLLISLYQQSDICLFPSKQEAWGLSAIEAMANKAAVVGFRTGCLKEIAVNNETALIVNNFEEKALELELDRLINDDILLTKLQNNAYELVKNYSWEKSGDRFEKLLIDLCGA